MKRFTAQMFGLEMPAYDNGRQLWIFTRLRKPSKCCICKVELPVSKKAWRPSSNAKNQTDRVCSVECLSVYETNNR